jgi:Leucine-rich repeat (LRR) protein
MKWLSVLIFLLLQCSLFAQNSSKNYLTIKEARLRPIDSVFYIRANKARLKSFPSEILQYHNLKGLDISNNKIRTIPDSLKFLRELRVLRLENIKLAAFPSQICALSNLEELILDDNRIEKIPDCIKYLSKLKKLSLFNTFLSGVPGVLKEMPFLEELDLQGMLVTKKTQELWRNTLLPQTKIDFDDPCNCLEGQ